MVTSEQAIDLVKADSHDGFKVTGLAGSTPTHWVVSWEPTDPNNDTDYPIPLVDRESGKVIYILPHVDLDKLEDFKEAS